MTARRLLLIPASLALLGQNAATPVQTPGVQTPAPAPAAAEAAVPATPRPKVDDRANNKAPDQLTPMPRRVATIAILNKQNGIARDVKMRPGQALRLGNVIVRLRACEKTPDWETPPLTGAFFQVDVADAKGRFHRVFSGWNYAETPSLNAMAHPVYDVWVKSCTMSFPGTGADTVVMSARTSPARSEVPSPVPSVAAAQASSAPKSPVAASASDSND